MGHRKGFVLILQSGAGGYLDCFEEADAYDRASHLGGDGWIFHFQCDGYSSRKHPGRRPVIKLRQVSTLGCPSASAMPAALAVAGMRHCVNYSINCD